MSTRMVGLAVWGSIGEELSSPSVRTNTTRLTLLIK